MGLPLLASLRRRYPRAFLGWVVERRFAGLLEGQALLDRAYAFDRPAGKRGLAAVLALPSFVAALADLRRRLRERRWDAAIVVQSRILAGLVGWLSGAPVRVVFAGRRKRLHWLFGNVRVRPPAGHMVEQFLALGAALGVEAGPAPVGEPPDASTEAQDAEHGSVLQPLPYAAAWAEKELGALPRPLVAVVLGASKADKIWPAERFAEVVAAVRGELGGCGVMAVGGPGDRALAGRLAALVGEGMADLTGATTLPQLVAVLARADLVVGGDTGPIHIAAALGRPVVALFAVTDPAFSGPWGEGHIVVESPNRRIEDLPAASVAEAALAVLRRPAAPGAG